jgi:hypothetical protein
MNKRLGKLFAIVLATTIVLSALPILMPKFASAAPTPPAFWLVPSGVAFDTGNASIGDTFTMTLWAGTATDVFTYQYTVNYDTSQIKCDSAAYTGGATSSWWTGHTTVATGPAIDNSTNPGTVTGGETLLGSDVVHASSGSVITMTFEIVAAPGVGVNLTSVIGFDQPNTYFLDPDLNTIGGISYGTANYFYGYKLPTTTPLMGAYNATENTFDKYTNWVGTTFDEHVRIENLALGWYVTNASADLIYNDTLLAVRSVVFDALWTGSNAYVNNTGALSLFAETPSSPLNGTVDIAVVTFEILNQGLNPPYPYDGFDASGKHLTNRLLYSSYDNIGSIPVGEHYYGDIVVYALQLGAPPFLSVDGGYIIGPGPSVGTLFNVTVTIHNVISGIHKLIGVQYRLVYDPTILEPVASYEGPFFPYWASLSDSLGTFFYDEPDFAVPWGANDLVGHMIFPNSTGVWNGPLPNGTGVITIITFKVLYQSFGEQDFCTPLTIEDQLAIGLDNLEDQNIQDVQLDPAVNGDVCITTDLPGRSIDLYGGAVNSGLIELDTQYYQQFVPPYGGQGPNAPMDLVEEQSWVYLNANITYNYWPVQHKLVSFEIQEPDRTTYTKLFAYSDTWGVASVGFRMPWPCENPESLFGVWTVTATVQLADITINDTMQFHYDYKVHIWKVTTDKYQYNHDECVTVTFEYGSHAQQFYSALFFVRIVDELGVTVGTAIVQTQVGGTVFCQYKNFTATVTICLPKWAYAGIARVYVDAFSAEPAEGGVALGPEFAGPTIAIQPY